MAPCSVHLSESVEEVEFIRSGTGPWRTFLEELRRVGSRMGRRPAAARCSSSTDAASSIRACWPSTACRCRADDLARLDARGATLVTCPRSNGHTGAGAPPLEDFYASGVRVAVGTDSLASAPDLNVFAELATMRALAPSVPATSLLDSATRQGARALGFDAEYGTIEPGKRARLLAVGDPARHDDVEEYLVSGIGPEQIRWLEV